MATAVAAVIAAATTACTQGVAADIPDVGPSPEATTAPVSSRSAPTSIVQTTALSPAVSSTTAPPATTQVTSPVTSPGTVLAAPPTIATQFASALAPVQVSVLGTPVSVPARDSVARLWLLVGRPPTAGELRTAVTAAVRDGVPLDAIATLLLNSPDGPVAQPAAPPGEFVADLYEGMLARRGKPDEVAAWVRGLRDGMSAADVAVEFAESPEAVQLTGTAAHEPLDAIAVEGVTRAVSDSVLRLYLGLLVRLPSADELDRDVDRYTHGEPLAVIAADLLHSAEYRDRRPASDPAFVLAGLFEDLLGSHPSQTVVTGWASQLTGGVSPGAVAAAFTESAAVVARTGTTPPVPAKVTPALPPPVAIMPGTDVLGVGDSVMLGASSALARQFPGIAIDAKVGRQFSEGVEIVRALAARGTIPDTVVVHLGTNGTVSSARCDELMGLLAGKRVVLVNVHVPRPWEAQNNDVLAACAARHGATIVDWHTNAVGLAPDGYHLGGSGPDAYATLIAAALSSA